MVSWRQLPRLFIVSYDPRRPLGVGSVRIKFAVITEFPAKMSHCSAPHGTASDLSIHGDRFKARRYVFSGN